jgi:mycothiol synthase
MSPDDAGQWAELLAAVEEVDRRDEHDHDCAEELADPELDLERDTIVVHDGPAGEEGNAVAYQVLRLRSGRAGGAHLISDAGVHPAHRRRASGTRCWPWRASGQARSGDPGHAGVRDAPVAPIPTPPGLAVASLGPYYDAARWDEPLRAAHNSAFAGGVAGALLAHVLQAARDDGYDTASPTVDAQNPPGALGVYARAGYRLNRREITFAVPPTHP